MSEVTPDPAAPERDAEVFRVLGHETRLRLLLLLMAGERAVGEIEAVSGVGQPGLSQQLAILRKAGVVATRRAAKQVYYRIEPAGLAGAMTVLGGLCGTAPPVAAALPRPLPRGSAARFARIV